MSHFGVRRPQASSDTAYYNTSDDRVISPVQDDSSVAGRAHHSLNPLGSPQQRSHRAPMPSPLSTASNATSGPTSASPRQTTFQRAWQQRPTDNHPPHTDHEAVEQTVFYSDSSNPPSPEPQSPRSAPLRAVNDTRSVSEPLANKPMQASQKVSRPAMAHPVAAAQGGAASHQLPRNSSIDSAISAMSSRSQARNGSQDGLNDGDIAQLIRTAGSAEAVIQHLLKEKHSQAQQNSQLWRLVDKQRAMILGLNKDLERALKEKEKYRKKLKEMIEDPAVLRAAGLGSPNNSHHDSSNSAAAKDSKSASEQVLPPAYSPTTLDYDSQKQSPGGMSLAPYPLTPPADQPQRSSTVGSAVAKLRQPDSKYNDGLQRKGSESASSRAKPGKDYRPISPNIAGSLPTEPPRMPPPNPPSAPLPSVPSLSVSEARPQPSKSLAHFPAPPPRKAPPAPLQLNKHNAPMRTTQLDDDDSESDYDDILEVDEIVNEKRGRRKTREEDDRQREILAWSEAEANNSSTAPNQDDSSQLSPRTIPPGSVQEAGPASLDAVLNGKNAAEFSWPAQTSGLPASPRPVIHEDPDSALSPRTMASFPSAPLSPRAPRQPIPLPPNMPLASADTPSPQMQRDDGTRAAEPEHAAGRATRQRTEPVRTGIYKGLMTEEYPELLLPPNALPSVEIKVASSRMKPSRASLIALTQLEEDPVFTLAVLSRSDGGELWRVEKDTAAFVKLDQRLKQCSAFTAKTPDRSLFSGHSPAKLDARRIALEIYFEELLDTPFDTQTAVELCRFLSSHTLPPNADETGASSARAAEGVGHKVGADGRPIRNGYLTKRGKNFGGWKARFFVLDGPLFRYYETPGGAHLGTIKLLNAQIGKQSPNNENQVSSPGVSGEDLDDQYRHAFLILEPKKKDSSSHVKHVLCAESDRERDLWVDALLKWVDDRDVDEEAASAKPAPTERQPPANTEPQTTGKIKKPDPRARNHQAADPDNLIGVRYDAMQAGDAPQLTSGRPKTSGAAPDQPAPIQTGAEALLNSQPSKLISGPKDGQVISDSAAWGNRTGPAPSNMEEKKQRKRSFFGFGPKARSSSEGQDSTGGSMESGQPTAATPAQNLYLGTGRQVFGASLAEAVRYCPPTDVHVPLPSVVYRCIQYLDDQDAALEEGIFRLSGSNVIIRQLRERFNTEGDIDLVNDEQYHDIHAVASLLKLYLRELPTTILTRDLHLDFLTTTDIPDRDEKIASLHRLAQQLPLANATLLKYLIAFLIKIINNSNVNKMTVRNVGIVFSPTLNIPAPVFAMLLQNYEAVFGIEPEEYELPSSVDVDEEQDQLEPLPPGVDLPKRPATSEGTASPHRPSRLDSMRHQRSTPTPPLVNNPNHSQGSPTPPMVASRPGTESPYGSDHWQQYDIGQGSPTGYDSQPSQSAGRHGYGQHKLRHQSSMEGYGSGSMSNDQSHSPGGRRRESAVYMAGMKGLQPQGSRSRLREESRP